MKDNLIVKSNQLIEARYDLNLNEQKIILYAISQINRDNKSFNSIELNITEFTDLLDTKGKRYEEIRNIVRDLRKKEIIINTEDKEYITGWLSSITFSKNTGKIKIRFDDDLIPYLLQLKNRFTRYQLRNILYLKSKYSIRMYELLKQYESIGKRNFSLKELKKILFIDDQYIRIYDFERFVLIPAKDEINKYTDIKIDYEKQKRGRKIVGIEFLIESKAQDNQIYIDYLEEYYNISEMKNKMGLTEENFNSIQIMDLYTKSIEKTNSGEIDPFEYIRLNYLYIKDKARNRFTYLMEALDKDYTKAGVQLSLGHIL